MSKNALTSSTAKRPTKKATINEWKGKIAGNQNWALRAAVRIHQHQTEEEKNTRATLESNGMGFNSFDAEFVTSVVQQHLEGKCLSKKQSDALRRIMPKYATQLYELVKAEKENDERRKGMGGSVGPSPPGLPERTPGTQPQERT